MRGKRPRSAQTFRRAEVERQPHDSQKRGPAPRARYGRVPDEWLADGGFAKHGHIEQLEAQATKVFAPVVAPKDKLRDRYAPLPGDSQALSQWRERMGTDAAKLIYKERAASIECTNAHLRNRGLQRSNVRGVCKVSVSLQPVTFDLSFGTSVTLSSCHQPVGLAGFTPPRHRFLPPLGF